MNDSPKEPEGLDDPALLAEIEAEFAELTAEIQRISAMPSGAAPRKSELLESLRASWRARLAARTGERPEWRKRLDDTIGQAVDRLLEDGIVENPDGSLAFALRGDTLKNEGGPLLRGLMDGLSNLLSERFPAPTPATPDEPPANPLQSLLGGLGHMLAGALKSVVAQVGTQPGAPVSTELPTSGGSVKIVVTPPAQSKADELARSGETIDAGAVDFRGEHQVAASFEIDTRGSSTDAAPTPGPINPAGATSNVFFQQLFAGLGQAVRQALAPAQPSQAQPSQAQPSSVPPPASTPDGAPPPDASTPNPSPAPSPFAGLSQLFINAIQKAFTPPVPGSTAPEATLAPTLVPSEVDPVGDPAAPTVKFPQGNPDATPSAPPPAETTTPTPSLSPTPDASLGAAVVPSAEDPIGDAAAFTVKIPQVNPENPPAKDQPIPSLNVDLAGLLRSILGNMKPPK